MSGNIQISKPLSHIFPKNEGCLTHAGGVLHTDILAVTADVSGVMLDWSIVGMSALIAESSTKSINTCQ